MHLHWITLTGVIMVTSCVAYGCTNRMKKGGNISFHKFPHDKPKLLEKWVQTVRGRGWSPDKKSFDCSVYFTDSCFAVRPGKLCCGLKKMQYYQFFQSFQNICKKLNQNLM